jgi:predicted Zn finger-like uncharacterized protein
VDAVPLPAYDRVDVHSQPVAIRLSAQRNTMPIPIDCPHCNGRFRASDAVAAKKVRCPKCQELVSVPFPPDEEEREEREERTATMTRRRMVVEEDTPAPRRRKDKLSQKSSSLPMILVIGGGVLILILMGGASLVWWLSRDKKVDTPEASAVTRPAGPRPDKITFPGRWQILDDQGNPATIVTLTDKMDARKSNAPDATGKWELVGNEARITWSDGWKDILRPQGDGKVNKLGFPPGTSWDNPTTDTHRAVKIPSNSTPPGTPRQDPVVVNKPPQKPEATPEDEVLAVVSRYAGIVRRDEDAPGKPIIAVNLDSPFVNGADLAVLKHCKQLRVLYLGAATTDADLKILKDLPQLQELRLDEARVTDAGMKEIKNLTQLENLNLNKTRITDAGLKELRDLPRLKKLWLADTGVTDAGLKELERFKNLKIVDLTHCKVTDAGVNRLRDQKPVLGIVFPDPPR